MDHNVRLRLDVIYIHGIDTNISMQNGPFVHNDIKPDNIVFSLSRDKN
jgi:serine/threonine protein kinase